MQSSKTPDADDDVIVPESFGTAVTELGDASEWREAPPACRVRVVPPNMDTDSVGKGVLPVQGLLTELGLFRDLLEERGLHSDGRGWGEFCQGLGEELVLMMYGPICAAAVELFEKKHGLKPTGNFGREVRELITKIYGREVDSLTMDEPSEEQWSEASHEFETNWVAFGRQFSWPPKDGKVEVYQKVNPAVS